MSYVVWTGRELRPHQSWHWPERELSPLLNEHTMRTLKELSLFSVGPLFGSLFGLSLVCLKRTRCEETTSQNIPACVALILTILSWICLSWVPQFNAKSLECPFNTAVASETLCTLYSHHSHLISNWLSALDFQNKDQAEETSPL